MICDMGPKNLTQKNLQKYNETATVTLSNFWPSGVIVVIFPIFEIPRFRNLNFRGIKNFLKVKFF